MLPTEASLRRRRAGLAHACPSCRQPWAVRAVRNPDGVFLLVCRFCDWRDLRRSAPAPVATVDGRSRHVVLLTDSEAVLRERLTDHVESALVQGRPCVVIATAPRRAALAAGLAARGLSGAACSGLVSLDAATTLRLFLRDGRPDPALFDASVGAVVRDAAADGRCVHVYGEMVSLLWQQGAHEAAFDLDDLWDRLGGRVELSVLCAYPAAGLSADDRSSIGARHSAAAS